MKREKSKDQSMEPLSKAIVKEPQMDSKFLNMLAGMFPWAHYSRLCMPLSNSVHSICAAHLNPEHSSVFVNLQVSSHSISSTFDLLSVQ